jgi:hypothetical protein
MSLVEVVPTQPRLQNGGKMFNVADESHPHLRIYLKLQLKRRTLLIKKNKATVFHIFGKGRSARVSLDMVNEL